MLWAAACAVGVAIAYIKLGFELTKVFAIKLAVDTSPLAFFSSYSASIPASFKASSTVDWSSDDNLPLSFSGSLRLDLTLYK